MENKDVLGSSPRNFGGIGLWLGKGISDDIDAALLVSVHGTAFGNHRYKGENHQDPLWITSHDGVQHILGLISV